MASASGLHGAPYYSAYAATRAYNIVLAESLWQEFKPEGVDIISVAAGMTLSSAMEENPDSFAGLDLASFQIPEDLVVEALGALGKQGLIIPGENNRELLEAAKSLPRETMCEYMAQHAIENFLGGLMPKQNIK